MGDSDRLDEVLPYEEKVLGLLTTLDAWCRYLDRLGGTTSPTRKAVYERALRAPPRSAKVWRPASTDVKYCVENSTQFAQERIHMMWCRNVSLLFLLFFANRFTICEGLERSMFSPGS